MAYCCKVVIKLYVLIRVSSADASGTSINRTAFCHSAIYGPTLSSTYLRVFFLLNSGPFLIRMTVRTVSLTDFSSVMLKKRR